MSRNARFSRRPRPTFLGAAAIGLVFAAAAARGADGLYQTEKDAQEDVFTVKDTVLAEKPAGFGLNIHGGAYNYGKPPLFNCYNPAWSFEPMSVTVDVYLDLAAPCADGTLRRTDKMGLSDSGKSLRNKIANGMSCYLMRRNGDIYERIYDGKVKDSFMRDGPADEANIGKEWMTLEPPPPPIADNDILQVDLLTTQFFDPSEAKKQKATAVSGKPAKRNYTTDFAHVSTTDDNGNSLFALDRTQQAPEGGSMASARLDIKGGNLHAIQSTLGTYPPAGTAMAVELWLRQEGMAKGDVAIEVGQHFKTVAKAGPQWRKLSFEFKTIEAVKGKPNFLLIGSREAGKLWVDNLVVYRKDIPPFAPLPEIVDEIKDMKTATIRFWNCGAWAAGNVPLRSWISGPFQQPFNAHSVTLGQSLQMAMAAGADPWFMMDKTVSDEAVHAMMEYLCAPPDVGYGRARAEQGRREPWVSAFKNIYFECDNESWGWGRNIDQYVPMLNRFIKLFRQNKYYKDGYFRIVGNDWAISPIGPEWGKPLIERTDADMYDMGTYIQGGDGVTIIGENDERQLRLGILNPQMVSVPIFDKAMAFRAGIIEKNPSRRKWTWGVYESGPGYIDGGSPKQREQSSRLGHSLALAIAMLDQYMTMTRLGFERICFYQFAFGGGQWSTHDGTIKERSIAWNAMKLRNVHCSGDLITLEPADVKTVMIPKQEVTKATQRAEVKKVVLKEQRGIHLTHGYAFKDESKYSFLFYNLAIDEARPVKLNLPFTPQAEAKMTLLTHKDPRVNNRVADTVPLTTRAIDNFASGYTFTLPPASALVIEAQAR